jgi:glycerol-3-phosphate dehydrogenase
MLPILNSGLGTKDLLKPISPDLPYLKVEIHYALTDEGAITLEDIFERRTRIGFESADHGESLVKEVAAIAAKILGWSPAEKKKAIDQYLDHMERERSALALAPVK